MVFLWNIITFLDFSPILHAPYPDLRAPDAELPGVARPQAGSAAEVRHPELAVGHQPPAAPVHRLLGGHRAHRCQLRHAPRLPGKGASG